MHFFFSLCVSSGCDAQLYMHFLVLRDVIILAEESCSSFYVPSVNPEMLEGGGGGNIQSLTPRSSPCQSVLRNPRST